MTQPNRLYWIHRLYSTRSPIVMLTLLKQLILPTVEYPTVLWGGYIWATKYRSRDKKLGLGAEPQPSWSLSYWGPMSFEQIPSGLHQGVTPSFIQCYYLLFKLCPLFRTCPMGIAPKSRIHWIHWIHWSLIRWDKIKISRTHTLAILPYYQHISPLPCLWEPDSQFWLRVAV